jgi:predicted transposase/invertase (TIGR01784 family)
MERYIDPFTDFGFKKIFGSEPNTDLLIDFLNELLKGKKQIKDLKYLKNEHFGKTPEYRKAVLDLYCENENDEKFIIELQRAKQRYFKDRSLYYSTFPIQEQGPQGDLWDYELKEVYTIGIMDFTFEDSDPGQFLHEIKLMETRNCKVFYDNLTFIYIEIPKFKKGEAEVETHFEKWLFLLQNLHKFTEIPTVLQERIFRKVFTIAEVSNLNEEDMRTYDASLKYKRDWENALDYAVEEARNLAIKQGIEEGMKKGMEKGIELGKEQDAREMKKENMAIDAISRITGLSIEEIEKL